MFHIVVEYTAMRSDTSTVHALRMGEMREESFLSQNTIFRSLSAFFLLQHTLAVHLSLKVVALLSGLPLGKV